MPYWLSSSKMRLGLLVNGLYLLSLFLPSHSQVGGRPYVHTYERPTFEASGRSAGMGATMPPPVVSLPKPTGPMKATSYREGRSGGVTVYLEKDLTLLETRGRRLLLSPSFTLRPDGSPDSVLLHFVSYSRESVLSTSNMLTITADGREVWPGYSSDDGMIWKGWRQDPVPPFVTETEDGVMENVGKTIPYHAFAKTIGAKTVVLSLGPDVLKLKAEQLEALRDMHRLWSDSRASAGRPGQF
jgi:hypothetical protein